ncbi:hypothetical protein CHS0354_015248 [Potamilus streckersoni]|uniref:Uncharacterized protein n=1 Tax=Potamilus streckersoni TaxID=2493646 RepID=A0AAE0RRB3_9BIVA|nr:hypothetical protein CHS0354_015248 [Potamilus streckersoni]
MSLRTNILCIIIPIAFLLFCLGAETNEPVEAMIPNKSLKTCTNVQLEDAVHLHQDIYEICCNSPNIFFRRDVCDAILMVKGKELQMMYNERQKRDSNSNLSLSYLLQKMTIFPPRSGALSAAIMSGRCMFPISTPKLGDVYGNCSGLYHVNSSDICLGACEPLDPNKRWRYERCKVTTNNDNCQMASGEMRQVITSSCQCSP